MVYAIFSKKYGTLAVLQTPLIYSIKYTFIFFLVCMRIPFTYKTRLFAILTFMSLSFLIFQSGVRAYLDASYQFVMANNFRLFASSLFDIS